jgi:GNAT superfamily N-acetyltransferase
VIAGLVVEPLTNEHDVASFDCGNSDLTDWLRKHARNAVGQGTRSYVLIEDGHRQVLGYFALAPHLIEREELPRRVGRGAPRQVPAILLAKLALDTRLQGQGLGRELLIRALSTVVDAALVAGGKVVVVDAVDDAAARFYEAHDFAAVPGHSRRLVMKLSTVAKALDMTWP